jgi:Bifunctional DNA primase/polymerase, N-terminal
VVAVTLPEKNPGPPQEADGAPTGNGTPSDHSNVNINSIRTPVKMYTGPWPVDFALWWAAVAPVIPQEHGKNIPHRRILGSGWSPKDGTVGSQDPEIIKAWWAEDPIANIGIVTAVSPLSRVLVIDVDTKPGKPNGWESINDLVKEYGPLPETTCVITPSGGTHLYYAMPEGEPQVRCRVGWVPGVDIPWLVPVPPSAKLVSSIYLPYRFWQQILGPLSEAPSWVFSDIRTRPGQRQRPIRTGGVRRRSKALALTAPSQPHQPIRTGGVRWHSEALPPTELFVENGLGWFTGSRDSDCFRLACRLWGQYGDEDTVVGLIFTSWERTPPKDHDFTWLDAYSKIKQAERYWRFDVENSLRMVGPLMRWF